MKETSVATAASRRSTATAGGWLVAVHPGSTTLSPDRATVIGYDLEGRPLHWLVAGSTFKRSLASEVFGRRTVAGVRQRWRVDEAHAHELFALAHATTERARGALDVGAVQVRGDAGAIRARLERAARWTPTALAAERERYLHAYRPVGILPPDQYHSVVLQATHGCSWNRCTYCTFYQDRPFSVVPEPAFEAHVEAVQALLGTDAAARAGIFLADGNALVLSNARLRPILAAAKRAFPGKPLAGFVDVFGGERKAAGDWRELRDMGLRSVAIGVETGHDPLLSYLHKPGSAAEAAAFVRQLKDAGLQVSVILMVGVGGRRFAAGHVRDSGALLERLPLGRGDLVYLSPFVVHPGSAYAARAIQDGTAPLGEAERGAQYRALRDRARAAAPEARVALYHIDEFVY